MVRGVFGSRNGQAASDESSEHLALAALQRAQQLLDGSAPAKLYCYRRLIGGQRQFWPPLNALGTGRRPLLAWRTSVLATVGRASPAPPTRRIVFELRRSSRTITNSKDLVHAVASDPDLSSRVSFVSFAKMTVAEQLRTARDAAGLAGVHGAGMAWLVFLPTRSEGLQNSVLELYPRQMAAQNTHAFHDYSRLAEMCDFRHIGLILNDSYTLGCDPLKPFRMCGHVVADVPRIMRILRRMLKRIPASHGSSGAANTAQS